MTEYDHIWTIGHSTRSWEEFLQELKSFKIEVLADVRRYPGSRKFPQFNVSELQSCLPASGISYMPLSELGGRRKPAVNSANPLWRNDSFRGYADYSDTAEFSNALKKLTDVATMKRTAYMCSELLWWRCHRAIISDRLKSDGWIVMHIMKGGISSEHPYTPVYKQTHSQSI